MWHVDDEVLYVDIDSLGTVIIKAKEDGIEVDIYPLHVSDKAIASARASIDELFHNEEEMECEE